jgi:hypothetical protein
MDIVVWCGVDLLEARRHRVLLCWHSGKDGAFFDGIPVVAVTPIAGKGWRLARWATYRRKDPAL